MAIYSLFEDLAEGKSNINPHALIYDTLHPELQRVIDVVSQHFDIVLIEGHRSEERQNMMRKNKMARRLYPKSKHNRIPSEAVDLMPYPLNYRNVAQAAYLAGHMRLAALGLGINLKWDPDQFGNNLMSEKIKPYRRIHHYELV